MEFNHDNVSGIHPWYSFTLGIFPWYCKWHWPLVFILPWHLSTHGIYPWYCKWHPPMEFIHPWYFLMVLWHPPMLFIHPWNWPMVFWHPPMVFIHPWNWPMLIPWMLASPTPSTLRYCCWWVCYRLNSCCYMIVSLMIRLYVVDEQDI